MTTASGGRWQDFGCVSKMVKLTGAQGSPLIKCAVWIREASQLFFFVFFVLLIRGERRKDYYRQRQRQDWPPHSGVGGKTTKQSRTKERKNKESHQLSARSIFPILERKTGIINNHGLCFFFLVVSHSRAPNTSQLTCVCFKMKTVKTHH